jgi:hypothetical protein
VNKSSLDWQTVFIMRTLGPTTLDAIIYSAVCFHGIHVQMADTETSNEMARTVTASILEEALHGTSLEQKV